MNLHTMKSDLSDLAGATLHQVSDSLHHGQDAIADTTQAVGRDVSRAASSALHSAPANRVGDALANVGKVLAAVTSAQALASMIRPEAPTRWVLGALNLQRRTNVVYRIAMGVGILGAGAAVGAGLSLLLSARTGPQNRARIQRAYRAFQHDAAGVVEQAEARVHEVVVAVENTARTVVADGNVDGSTKADASGNPSPKGRPPGITHRTPTT